MRQSIILRQQISAKEEAAILRKQELENEGSWSVRHSFESKRTLSALSDPKAKKTKSRKQRKSPRTKKNSPGKSKKHVSSVFLYTGAYDSYTSIWDPGSLVYENLDFIH